MKTAVSIPDEIFAAADELARRAGMSRSELYAKALSEYLRRDRYAGLSEKLDEIYSKVESALDPAWVRAQAAVLKRDRW